MAAGPLPARFARALGVRATLALRRALLAAADALVPPPLVLFEQAAGIARTQLLHAVARLRIADLLAAGPRPVPEVARAAGVEADALRRALRALAKGGVFELRPGDHVANTRLSEAFRSDVPGSLRDFLDYQGTASTVAAWADLAETLRTGRSAFPRVHGTSVWDWFARHPEEGRTFSAAMRRLTELDAAAIADGYAFGELGSVCDVAGGEGTLLAAILARHPRLRGVLLEAPEVIARAPALLERSGVASRVECRPGNFFHGVPERCDAYLLKDVLHDWDDEAATRILVRCARAAAPGARLVVAELLLDRDGAGSPAALVDVQMLAVTDQGRQRSACEHHALMARAGWAPAGVRALPSLLSLVEGVKR